MFFQQSKRMHEDLLGSAPNAETNFALGAVAAAASVCVMIPVDTIKTRLVTQVPFWSPRQRFHSFDFAFLFFGCSLIWSHTALLVLRLLEIPLPTKVEIP